MNQLSRLPLILAILMLCPLNAHAAKSFTMTTYYPAPAGEYDSLTVANPLTVTSGNIAAGNAAGTAALGITTCAGRLTANNGLTVASGTTILGVTSTGGLLTANNGLTVASGNTSLGITNFTGAVTANNDLAAATASIPALTASTSVTTPLITSAADIAITPLAKVTVNGDMYAAAYYHTSDRRLKENIVPITNGLTKVLSLNGVNYNLIGKEQKKIGFIAQDVEAVVPEVVTTNAAGFKSMEYGELVAILVEAVKTQQTMISQQQQEIDELKRAVEKFSP